ncbi:hypothetical protein [Duganella rivi]|nr:hypothetical protein [Duganella rivi]
MTQRSILARWAAARLALQRNMSLQKPVTFLHKTLFFRVKNFNFV